MRTGCNGKTETVLGAGRQVEKFTVVQWYYCEYSSHCIPVTGSYQYFPRSVSNKILEIFFFKKFGMGGSYFFPRVVGVSVSCHSGGQLATTLVATISVIIFLFFSTVYFSQRRSAQIKNKHLGKVDRSAQKYRSKPFSRPHRPFWGPWQPFLIFEALIEGMIESENLFSKSWSEVPITKSLTSLHTPSAILGPPGGHFGLSRQWYFWKVTNRSMIIITNNHILQHRLCFMYYILCTS